jgi:putative membrane protein
MNLDIYCGPAPTPASLWTSWNFDPPLLAAIAALFVLLLTMTETRFQRRCTVAALFLALIAFVSPLCALASALFSARILHHILIVALIAPLVVMALPHRARQWTALPGQVSFIVHTIFVWFWHAPEPYLLALTSPAVYWMMEITLAVSAVWLWYDILQPRRPLGAAIALLLGTTLQMAMLGALLTFARQPLFTAHIDTTHAFGVSPLADQQLAGLLMWVPAALPYLLAALLRLRVAFAGRTLDSKAPR